MASKIYNLGNIQAFEMPTEIFNGIADSTSTIYTLSDDISKYKLLLVSFSCGNGTYSNKDSIIIDVESIEHNIQEYRSSILSTNSYSTLYTILFSFPTNTTLKIDESGKVGSWTLPKIHRIVGIK